ncbi:MAG: HD-GYP domain-containing protein [Terriglobia bacterium]
MAGTPPFNHGGHGVDYQNMKNSVLLPGTEAVSVPYKPRKGRNWLIKQFNEVVNCLAFVCDIEDGKHYGHAWRVAIIAARLAERLRIEPVDPIFYAALLHDVGTAGARKHILNIPRLADQIEDEFVENHPYKGAEQIRSIPGLCVSADLVLEHHERFDGTGYPSRKKGLDLSPGSQVIRAADAFDFWFADYRLGLRRGGDNGFAPFVEFHKAFGEAANRELADDVLYALIELVREDDLCQMILRDDNLPLVMQELIDSLPGLEIPPNVDLLGKILTLFGEVVDCKLPYTEGHSKRTAQYALSLATALNLGHEVVTRVKWAALIHDVGKVGLPKTVLTKKGPLNRKEWAVVRQHPEKARDRLQMIASFGEIGEVLFGSAEHYDGSGYPRGLKGDKIPVGSRIIAVADALEAMTCKRSYRSTWTVKEALHEILSQSGKQFDPEMARAANLVFGS